MDSILAMCTIAKYPFFGSTSTLTLKCLSVISSLLDTLFKALCSNGRNWYLFVLLVMASSI